MQQLNPSEISEVIKKRIENLDISSQAQNEGTVVSVSDGIVRIHGLAEAMYGEMIEFEGGVCSHLEPQHRQSRARGSWLDQKHRLQIQSSHRTLLRRDHVYERYRRIRIPRCPRSGLVKIYQDSQYAS